jgi:hypothetical protein
MIERLKIFWTLLALMQVKDLLKKISFAGKKIRW